MAEADATGGRVKKITATATTLDGAHVRVGNSWRMNADRVEFEIPGTVPSASNLREHWAVKAKRVKVQRLKVWLMGLPLRMWLSERTAPPERCVVTLTRVSPRLLDDDNIRGALKAQRDQVAQMLGVDDRDPRVTWVYEQAKGKPSCLRVAVEALNP
jgi:hypothetical protein